MLTVLTFTCMLRHYNVESSRIYLYAEALQCGQFSYNVESYIIYLYAETLQCGQFSHLPVC